VAFLASAAGLPRQRNTILDAAADCDVVLFLDDDFLPGPDYLLVTERVLQAQPGCVVTTGTVLADGAKGPGLSVAEGRAVLAADRYEDDPLAVAPHFNGYGCNMALRLAPLRAHGIRVDEALPFTPGTRIST
jgi:glycosyltransferase involved in cell wall biosynthesis